MNLSKSFVLFIISYFIFSTSSLYSQWTCSSYEGLPIVTEANNQWNHQIIRDPLGKFVIVWQDRRSTNDENVYIQRLNKLGLKEWQTSGIRVTGTAGHQFYPHIISDSTGIIVVWQDSRNGNDYDIYAQKINYNGQLMWTTGGVPVCTASGNQYNPRIVSDNSGGAIITWQDYRNGTDYNIFIQRISSNGQALWTNNGIAICTSPYDQFNPRIVSDDIGGVIVAWHDYRAGNGFSDIYAQRISRNGELIWQFNGVCVCNATHNQSNLQMIADGFRGALIVWQDRRSSLFDDIYIQKLNSNGNSVWTANGLQLTSGNGFKFFPQLATDHFGGAVITWQDNRIGTDYNIYAQSVNYQGVTQWPENGVAVCTAPGHQYYPQITIDELGNSIIVWQDRRNGTDYEIYTQRIIANGTIDWNANGVAVSNAAYDQIDTKICSDGDGGAVIVWTDYRSGSGYMDIYSNIIGVNGKLAGGCYRTFLQNDFEVKGIRIKARRGYPIPMPNVGNVRDTIFGRSYYPNGVILGLAKSDSQNFYGWIRVVRKYNVKRFVPQTGESVPFIMKGERIFIKELRNPTPYRYDNHLVGELLTLKLNIAASNLGITESGFSNIIYCDTIMNNYFNGKSIQKIVAFTDSALTKWRNFQFVNYYLLDSVITRINRAFSGPIDSISTSPLVIKNTRGVYNVSYLKLDSSNPPLQYFQSENSEIEEPLVFKLYQNYPNPFNPFTNIEFELSEASFVSLKIYNTLGQEVTTLIENEEIDAGRNVVTFFAEDLSSGVYFYRLILNNGESQHVRKMIFIK